MSIINPLENKEQFYGQVFVLANAFLIFSIIMFSIYLVAPLLGSKLSISALIHYGSWILVAIWVRIISRRRGRGAGGVYENTLRTPMTKPTKVGE